METLFWVVLGICLLLYLDWLSTRRKVKRDKEIAEQERMVRRLIQEEIAKKQRRM